MTKNSFTLNYIVIEGNIGVGKTSLVKMLVADLNARGIYEKFEENPFLPKFYSDPQRYAFTLELSFLADRYRQNKEELTELDIFSPLNIADYYFSKSLIFARITLDNDEFILYSKLYNIIHQNLPFPDLYVYLHSPVEQLMQNIKLRGRKYEKEISSDYLKSIQDGYFQYMNSRKNQRFLIVEMKNLDFVNRKEDYKSIKSYIFDRNFEIGITRIPAGKY